MGDFQAELKAKFGIEVPAELLELALTHPSAVGEGRERTLRSNQRLEFLGDALVGAIVAEYFYLGEPNLPEGELTTRKIASVRREALAAAAERLGLGARLILGSGERKGGGASRPSNLSDVFEALIGAVYLGCGWEEARKFVVSALGPELAIDVTKLISAKNRLQEITQASGLGTPRYRTGISGTDAAQFASEVLLQDEVRGKGLGKSKKLAEEAAAEAALAQIFVGVEGQE
jgi:ribonuclease-3